MRFLWHNIILGGIVNILFASWIAYIFMERCKRKKGFFWTFLSDKNQYGNATWKPELKNKFLRAYFWMIRNPRQNWDDTHRVDGKDTKFKGTGKVKDGHDIISFRAFVCIDTGNNHGKIIDWNKSSFGVQDITFMRVDEDGNVQNCFRKSTCIPIRFMYLWIMMWKWRRGHQDGLMQYSVAKSLFVYKNNKEGFQEWKQKEWKIIKI